VPLMVLNEAQQYRGSGWPCPITGIWFLSGEIRQRVYEKCTLCVLRDKMEMVASLMRSLHTGPVKRLRPDAVRPRFSLGGNGLSLCPNDAHSEKRRFPNV